jgi:hypothetical protein
MFVSIWTNEDTAERGPTVDEESASIIVEAGPTDGTTLLHLTSDGPAGLWTAAATMTRAEAVRLAHALLGDHTHV